MDRSSISKRLPPLNALRGFEAAARLKSFARAADELSLTQSAVGHQVRQLEAALGQSLFVRRGRELVLTDAGRDFLLTVRNALDVLGTGFERLAPYRDEQSLIVSCDAAFSRLWLLPRLAAFRRERPSIMIWLDTSELLLDFDHQEVEIVLGRLNSTGEGRQVETLFDERLAPGRRPQRDQPALRVEELGAQTLIHDERRDGWLEWLAFAGGPPIRSNGPRFSDSALALEAARLGQGVALLSDVLAYEALQSGDLETPLDHWYPVTEPYQMAFREPASEILRAFVTFVRREAQSFASDLAAFRARADQRGNTCLPLKKVLSTRVDAT